MSSTTLSTTTMSALSRVRQYAAGRRELSRGRRELDAVLAGHHGVSMREELLSVRGRF